MGYFEGLSGGNLVLDFQNKLELLEENDHEIIVTATPSIFSSSGSTSCELYVTIPSLRKISLKSSSVTNSTLKVRLAEDLNGESICKLVCSDNLLVNGANGATGGISFVMTTSRDTITSTAKYIVVRNSVTNASLNWINGSDPMMTGDYPGSLLIRFTITRALSRNNFIFINSSQGTTILRVQRW